ncbi:AP-3 complex subunit mu-1 [Ceratocystis fimbriata CBS 114723]|uniref:AP-3 complex subunit mu-1 n=1 Tax=Ceratocystis fimbriata CBS 114723 TaxID=1035309 RepID=A0A2C5WVY9_9PEZI|nr:AP-3 complex subunit mu-1 [Ceratocystis fimbriata CBS 114723]
MNGIIESVHILDERNNPILSHIYNGRPPSSAILLPPYLAHSVPRPNLMYLQSTNPPTLLFSLKHDDLLLFATASEEIEPLVVLEFLHRIVDALEEFIGAPVLPMKLEQNYEIIAQLLNEMCDAGTINTTEPNALRDLVEVEGWVDKLLGSISIPTNPSFASTFSKPALPTSTNSNIPALPWRRANVRHTTNEMYCDVVESLSVTFAPSGRPLAAFAHGTIAFTSKVSGVPDVVLMMSTASGKHHIEKTMELPVFHPCVRLQRWKEHPGELSFVPPDGRFILASYEVDLLPPINDGSGSSASLAASGLKLPISVEIKKGLGATGAEFEVRLQVNKTFTASAISGSALSRAGPRGVGASAPITMEDLCIKIPFSEEVKNLPEVRPSRGDAIFNTTDKILEWKIPTKEIHGSGNFSLRCTVRGHSTGNDDDDENDSEGGVPSSGLYDFDAPYQRGIAAKAEHAAGQIESQAGGNGAETEERSNLLKMAQNKILMPSSVMVSFSIKGWLASGLKVESINLDPRKSKGLGEGVKPYKGVKYVTV